MDAGLGGRDGELEDESALFAEVASDEDDDDDDEVLRGEDVAAIVEVAAAFVRWPARSQGLGGEGFAREDMVQSVDGVKETEQAGIRRTHGELQHHTQNKLLFKRDI